MKTSRNFCLAAIILAAALSAPVQARGGHGGSHGGGHWGSHGHRHWSGHGWGWGGVALGAALVGSAYWASNPYYYRYPYSYGYPYAAPASMIYEPPLYAAPAQQPMAAPAPVANTWYYCRPSNAYYPYVRTCATGWEQVPTTPPGQ